MVIAFSIALLFSDAANAEISEQDFDQMKVLVQVRMYVKCYIPLFGNFYLLQQTLHLNVVTGWCKLIAYLATFYIIRVILSQETQLFIFDKFNKTFCFRFVLSLETSD